MKKSTFWLFLSLLLATSNAFAKSYSKGYLVRNATGGEMFFLDKKLNLIGTLAGPVGSLKIPDDAFPIYAQSCLKGSCPDDEFRLEITDAHCYVIWADLVDTDPDQYTYSTSRWPCAWGAKPIPPHMKPLSKGKKKQSLSPKKALESEQKPSAHQKEKPSEK